MKKVKALIIFVLSLIFLIPNSAQAMFEEQGISEFDYLLCKIEVLDELNDLEVELIESEIFEILDNSKIFSLKDDKKRSIFMYICAIGFHTAVERFASCGVEFDQPDAAGNTALTYAKVMGHERIATFLKQRKAQDLPIDEKRTNDLIKQIEDWRTYIRGLSSKYPQKAVKIQPQRVQIPMSMKFPSERPKIDCPEVAKMMTPLDQFVGMEEFKRVIEYALISEIVRKKDQARGHKPSPPKLHMILTGNPGTGKTTVAGMLTKIYYDAGLIKENKFKIIESRGNVVGKFIGDSENNIKNILEETKGGVLFIDEAYTYYNKDESGRDFGRKVIEGLLNALTKSCEEHVIILAGYEDRMEEFLELNAGLKSRFRTVNLPDYNSETLYSIFEKKIKMSKYVLCQGVKEKSIQLFELAKQKPEFGNARFAAENFFERVKDARAYYLMALPKAEQDSEWALIRAEYVIEAARSMGYELT